jgi:hypothetical protein
MKNYIVKSLEVDRDHDFKIPGSFKLVAAEVTRPSSGGNYPAKGRLMLVFEESSNEANAQS